MLALAPRALGCSPASKQSNTAMDQVRLTRLAYHTLEECVNARTRPCSSFAQMSPPDVCGVFTIFTAAFSRLIS
jgi:hypothetical protein